MDAPGHLLSLKVMRVSRPTLASSWQPFFTSSPSFSAHATESLLSLQGKEPLPGHPKTLRDLTHASQLLTLPSTFGAIQLGETFTSCLCVNNEATVAVEAVSLRIEMQTATNKVVLAEVGGPDQHLNTTDVLEAIVSHEMKELGQHVLACYVSYLLPPSSRTPLGQTGDLVDPSLQTFRKYYKFAVTNPLNVKTKVHVPRSPTALLSRTEREKVFLEIHVQNLTQEPMWFEHMRFECVDGWEVTDGNISHEDGKNLFSDSISIMQPQDIRQYVYILTPTSIPSFPVTYSPGTIIPLGRLDLSWRSSFGEPGRLLTSLLTRRIPIPTAQPAPSAIPPHLQYSRPRSPQQTLSRPSTPPTSPNSFKPRPPSQQVGRPQSPASFIPPSHTPPTLPDLEVDLVVLSIPRSDITLEQPFKVAFQLTLSGLLPTLGKTRNVHLVVQHIQPIRTPPVPHLSMPTPPINLSPRPSLDIWSSNRHLYDTARRDTDLLQNISPTASPRRGGPLTESPLINHSSEHQVLSPDIESRRSSTTIPARASIIRLPPPFSQSIKHQSVLHLGVSAIFLPPLQLSQSPPTTPTPEVPNVMGIKGEVIREFECTFVPVRKGIAKVGGLRVILIEDREIEASSNQNDLMLVSHANAETKVLREWDVIGEVWVTN